MSLSVKKLLKIKNGKTVFDSLSLASKIFAMEAIAREVAQKSAKDQEERKELCEIFLEKYQDDFRKARLKLQGKLRGLLKNRTKKGLAERKVVERFLKAIDFVLSNVNLLEKFCQTNVIADGVF